MFCKFVGLLTMSLATEVYLY